MGIPNFDPETQIHYGVISQHSSEAVTELLFTDGEDLSFVEHRKQLLAELCGLAEDSGYTEAAIALVLETYCVRAPKYVTEEVYECFIESHEDPKLSDHIWDIVEQYVNDSYQNDDPAMAYEGDGYAFGTCLISDIFVFKSPFYTFTVQCSPCVPNAGNLDSAPSAEEWVVMAGSQPEGKYLKTYCPGHDMFENERAPYAVWFVENNRRAYAITHFVDCRVCNGLRTLSISEVVGRRATTAADFLEELKRRGLKVDGDRFTCWSCLGTGTEKATTLFDGFEVHPLAKLGEDSYEVCDDDYPDIAMWSVYGHRPEVGIMSLQDCKTEEEADAVFDQLVAGKVVDFTVVDNKE